MPHPTTRTVWPSRYAPLVAYIAACPSAPVRLTFAEIEDLLGSPLPDAARHEPAWWSGVDTVSEQSSAWTLATRSADASCASGRVVFDRNSTATAP